MVSFRHRNRQYALKIETTPGTDASPAAAADAIALMPADFQPNFEAEDTSREVTGGLDAAAPIPAGGYQSFPWSTYLRGNATPGSAAPKVGRLLRAGGFAETLLAADATGTAQAGATGSITLAAGASAVDNAYKGMVIETTAGTGSGQKRVITAYVGATKVASVYPNWTTVPDATTVYAVKACALYRPVSTGLEAVSFYQWEKHSDGVSNAILTKLVGAMTTLSLELAVRRAAMLTGSLRGLCPGAPTDVAAPAAPAADTLAPPLFQAADAWLGANAVKFNAFSLASNAQVEQFDNPAAAFGYDEADLLARSFSGRLAPNRTSMATRNAMQEFLDGTQQKCWLRWGATAGSRVSLYMPALQHARPSQPGEQRGYSIEQMDFRLVGVDDAAWVAVY